MYQYIKRETKIENYDPCPRFLSKMKVSPIAKLVYTTLLGRTFLSRKNGLKDENGNVYVIYPVRALAKYIGRTEPVIYGALRELEVLDLIERKKVHSGIANHIYVKFPDNKENVRMNAKKVYETTKEDISEALKNSEDNLLSSFNTNKSIKKETNKYLNKYEKEGRL